MNQFPLKTREVLQMKTLIKHKERMEFYKRMSTRMVKCASVLEKEEFLGWEMHIPTKGVTQMYLFGTGNLCKGDLEWIAEYTAKTKEVQVEQFRGKKENLGQLFEVFLPVAEQKRGNGIGFEVAPTEKRREGEVVQWPLRYSSQFAELIRAFRETGAVFRAVIGSANVEEQRLCEKEVLKSWETGQVNLKDYIGRPVRSRFLLRLPGLPSIRLRTIFEEAAPGVALKKLGTMEEKTCIAIWENPLANATVLPDCAARILLMEPEVKEALMGMEVCEEPVKPIPASHKNTKASGAVTIGRAVDTTGSRRKITIGELDLRRHYEIVGQTGTGKSTLLSNLILSAIEQGHGLTFFDPHGSTVDTVIQALPREYIDKVRIVRIGDADHPVPISVWSSDDPEKEERTINDLCELFSDIFDPQKEGFIGPRWERWWATFAKAAIALLGRQASFESIALISQSRGNMMKVSKAIGGRYPSLAETIKEEYEKDQSSDFQNTLNWYLCKFQRLTAVEQLRKTLGAGTDALDFHKTIDTDKVTLIDLASPAIGTHAARIVGTMLLMKLWNAAMERKEREGTHIVVVDEASLFQTNPMPRMLAESRKFGLSMVLSHQHEGQLTREIRDALEANSANFSAFRLSPRDALVAAARFDDEKMRTGLTRLDAFRAITTLSVDGQQTAPFTLEIARPKRQKNGKEIAAEIERQSIRRLVEPYRSLRALTKKEILQALDEGKLIRTPEEEIELSEEELMQSFTESKWLYAWKENEMEKQ